MDRISAKIKDHLHQIFAFLSHNFFSRTSSLPSARPKHRPTYQLLVAYQQLRWPSLYQLPKMQIFSYAHNSFFPVAQSKRCIFTWLHMRKKKNKTLKATERGGKE